MKTLTIFSIQSKCSVYQLKMWQDNEIRFDTNLKDLQMGNGEVLIDKLDMIEDTKGNVGDQGRLLITNLRIMWHSLTLPRINLSIGFNAVITISTKNVSLMQGHIGQALHILTTFKNSRYEFIFTNLNIKSSRHYTSVTGIHRAYTSSKIYREMKLRGGFIQNKRLQVLPSELINSTTPGVWNLSTEQGNVGTLIVTNIRIVWFADMNHHFNASIPYLTISNISLKNSKYGPTLVIISSETIKNYILGFRVDPAQKLHILHKEIMTQKLAYDRLPIFGIDYTFEYQKITEPELKDDSTKEIYEDNEISNSFGLYFTQDEIKPKKPNYFIHLGLAAEEPREGSSLQSLWELLPGN